jgi:hypothetical protein
VLESAIDEETRAYVKTVATRFGCEYFGTHVLPGLGSNGNPTVVNGPVPQVQLELPDPSPRAWLDPSYLKLS